jgi:hypothetical protein
VAFIGPFGTGKTEIAINYGLAALHAGRDTCLIDFDIVTPYFRVGDCRQRLEELGLRVIAAEGALAFFDSPSLSPEIGGALRDDGVHVVLDVGGDPEGARLLGVYASQIAKRDYDLWLVVNPYRPGSSVEGIDAQRREIEDSTALRINGLVANPHLGPLTERAHIERGMRVVHEASDRTGLPIALLAVAEHLVADLPPVEAPVLPLRLFLHLPWEGS